MVSKAVRGAEIRRLHAGRVEHLQLSSARGGFHDLILIVACTRGLRFAAVDGIQNTTIITARLSDRQAP